MLRRQQAPASDGGYKSGESGSSEQPRSQDAATGRETFLTPPLSTLLLFAQQMEVLGGGGEGAHDWRRGKKKKDPGDQQLHGLCLARKLARHLTGQNYI